MQGDEPREDEPTVVGSVFEVKNRPFTQSDFLRQLGKAKKPLNEIKLSYTATGDAVIPSIHRILGAEAVELRGLTLQGCELTSACVPALCHLLTSTPKLELLCLSDNDFTDENVDSLATAFRSLTCLTSLHIAATKMSDDAMAMLLASTSAMPMIRVLGLRNSGAGPKAFSALADVVARATAPPTPAEPTSEDAPADSTTAPSPASASASAPPPPFPLEQLQMKGLDFSNALIAVTAPLLVRLQCLRKFEAPKSGLGPEAAVTLIAEFEKLPSLTALNLAENHIGDTSGEVLSTLFAADTQLRSIHLKRNGITCVGIQRMVPGLKKNTGLRELDLSENPLMVEGCIALFEALKENTGIHALSVSSVGGDPQAVRCLGDLVLTHPTMVHLDYSGNLSGADGCAAICHVLASPQCRLRRIFFSDNDIPEGPGSFLVETIMRSDRITHANIGGQSKVPPRGNAINAAQMRLIGARTKANREAQMRDGDGDGGVGGGGFGAPAISKYKTKPMAPKPKFSRAYGPHGGAPHHYPHHHHHHHHHHPPMPMAMPVMPPPQYEHFDHHPQSFAFVPQGPDAPMNDEQAIIIEIHPGAEAAEVPEADSGGTSVVYQPTTPPQQFQPPPQSYFPHPMGGGPFPNQPPGYTFGPPPFPHLRPPHYQ